MDVSINDFNKDKAEEIKAAAKRHWPFDEWHVFGDELASCEDGNLCEGESEEEFAERLSLAVWKANGAFCTVGITATYLEDLPCECYELGEEDYERLKSKIAKQDEQVSEAPL
jgi:hypothetical protein